MSKRWYEIKPRAQANATDPAEVYILGAIGEWGISAAQFIRDVKALNAPALNVYLDSPGGDYFTGLTIANFLATQPNVTTHVLGMAASIGAIVHQAGAKRTMASNTYLMLHDPWGLAVGNATELREYADWLDHLGVNLTGTVAKRTGQDEKAVAKWMTNAETWFSAKEAKEANLVDEVTETVVIQNRFAIDRFQSMPGELTQALTGAGQSKTQSIMNKFAQLFSGKTQTPPPAAATPPPAPAPAAAAAPPAPPAISPRETFLFSALEAFGLTAEAIAEGVKENKTDFAADFVAGKIEPWKTRETQANAALKEAGLDLTVADIADGKKKPKEALDAAVAKETARLMAGTGGKAAGRDTGADDDTDDLDSIRAEMDKETDPAKKACLARRARTVRLGADRLF